jgi:hypothetical protein
MKKILLLLMLLTGLSVNSQNFTLKLDTPTLSSKSMLMLPKPIYTHTLHVVSLNKSLMLAIKPKKMPFKLTIKPGFNPTQLRKVVVLDKTDPDWRDDVDDVNITGIAKYDVRLKFYTSKRTRIVLRSLIAYQQNLSTIGFVYKF